MAKHAISTAESLSRGLSETPTAISRLQLRLVSVCPAPAFAIERAFIVDGGDFKELAQHRARVTSRTSCQDSSKTLEQRGWPVKAV